MEVVPGICELPQGRFRCLDGESLKKLRGNRKADGRPTPPLNIKSHFLSVTNGIFSSFEAAAPIKRCRLSGSSILESLDQAVVIQ
jgi:hypothetical protein